MKQIKVVARQKGSRDSQSLNETQQELKATLRRLRKKGLNPMQMSHKLTEHQVVPPGGGEWTYDRVVEECKKLDVPTH